MWCAVARSTSCVQLIQMFIGTNILQRDPNEILTPLKPKAILSIMSREHGIPERT